MWAEIQWGELAQLLMLVLVAEIPEILWSRVKGSE